mmetsp:Transcript_1320/g.2696  ORF Transcript_1320/g.2696 Transcript_1320/m.2696 type:complete len:320 (-) Transcript_1320:54-1013(-)
MYISAVKSAVQKQRKTWMFVWDFDKTLTKSHASDQMPPVAQSWIAHDLVDADFFRKVTKHLHGQGHCVKIASWADGPTRRHVLTDYMTFLFGPNEKRHYLRNEGLEAFIPHAHGMANEGKNIHIRNLLRQVNAHSLRVENDHVVLFDDNDYNCIKAREAGHRSVHCPHGFNREAWSAFISSFRDRKPSFHSDALLHGSHTRLKEGGSPKAPIMEFQKLCVEPVLQSVRSPASPTSSPRPDVIHSYLHYGDWLSSPPSPRASLTPPDSLTSSGASLTSLPSYATSPGASLTSLPDSSTSLTSLPGTSNTSTRRSTCLHAT